MLVVVVVVVFLLLMQLIIIIIIIIIIFIAGGPRRRWENNIRMDLQEVGLGYEDWIGLAQDRDRWRARVSAVRNLRVP